MGSLYYELKTNVTIQKEGAWPSTIDHLIFQTPDGNYLEVESQGLEQFENENGVLAGHWRGNVMYRRLDERLDYLGGGEFSVIDNDEFFYTLIMNSETKLVGFRVDEDSLVENGYSDLFVPECNGAEVWFDFSCDNEVYSPRFKADRLLTDGALEIAISEVLGRGGM